MSALYQRARPFTFDQVVGQEHVKDVLGSAVARGMTGHAYLFSGPRGVGKTTTARLMAMAVNCEREDPAQRPCGECESCRLVRNGSHPDVVELDAASNNSVDDVRALREQVGLASLRGGTRVWILDEAHMLSRAAANALLKTLEEPPSGLMFVLATTEPEKLPPTILSRCQHFRFRRLTDAEILGKLVRLCQDAGVAVEEEALSLVARAADGAMRDAESLLERLLVSGRPVTAADAEDALGLPPQERLAALAQALLAGDLTLTLPAAADLYRAGYAPRTVAEQLGRTLRDLLHEALGSGASSERDRLVRLIHALDDEQERFVRRDDLYALEVAIIKANNAVSFQGSEPHAGAAEANAVDRAPVESTGSTADDKRAVTSGGAAGRAPAARPGSAADGAREDAASSAPTPARSPGVDPDTRSPKGRAGAGGPPATGKAFSWHAVRSAAAPQLKAFLQPAQVSEEGGVVTIEYGDDWRFHFDQVVARREELETLIEKVAGAGFQLDLQGPRGSHGGGRRGRGGRGGGGGDSSAASQEPSARPAPREHEASAVSEESASPFGDLSEDFWSTPAEPGGDDALGQADVDEPLASTSTETAEDAGDGTSLARLQALFPGRVVEFVPTETADAAEDVEAAPAPVEEGEGYDDDAQDRLGFGVPARSDG